MVLLLTVRCNGFTFLGTLALPPHRWRGWVWIHPPLSWTCVWIVQPQPAWIEDGVPPLLGGLTPPSLHLKLQKLSKWWRLCVWGGGKGGGVFACVFVCASFCVFVCASFCVSVCIFLCDCVKGVSSCECLCVKGVCVFSCSCLFVCASLSVYVSINLFGHFPIHLSVYVYCMLPSYLNLIWTGKSCWLHFWKFLSLRFQLWRYLPEAPRRWLRRASCWRTCYINGQCNC